jgi:hypothetical protein
MAGLTLPDAKVLCKIVSDLTSIEENRFKLVRNLASTPAR